jgi:hypothetical protein
VIHSFSTQPSSVSFSLVLIYAPQLVILYDLYYDSRFSWDGIPRTNESHFSMTRCEFCVDALAQLRVPYHTRITARRGS